MPLSSRIFVLGFLGLAFACANPQKSATPVAATPAPSASPAAHKAGAAPAKNAKGPPAAAKASAAAPSGDGLEKKCTLNDDHRTIVVVPKDSGCEVHYVKNGAASVVANSVNGTTYCDGVQTKMAKNLEDAGFACR